ncbi:hypothetical protein AEAC466_02735 [Asticcacaulis sp. AC466]|uniref:efflux transporter outer membrane subunit n=1 Tax=Asticcacaulis sp. AC466 TaxID=1282362 RepID=UPI0003C3D8EF|nr:efflux transporter outer membrane subunit [Asticcacaulis sp. AC466]ESQ86124.1 hypothetical protein AEAC466_02735 [Asticcacaulis sp. AC466]
MTRLPLVLIALTVAGCAGPRQGAPLAASLTPPVQWRGQTGEGILSPGWWRSFNDPVLDRLVETALANNTDIAIAAARVEEARAQFRVSEGALLPSIGASAGGAHARALSAATGLPVTQTSGQVGLQVSYEVDLFGRLRNASAAARAALAGSEANREAVRLSVAAATASGYVTLRALDARLTLLKDTLATREKALASARHRAETGYSPRLELEQADAEYQAAAQLIPVTELAIRRQEDALSLLLGDSPRAIERGAAFDALTIPSVPQSLPSQLVRRRPDIAQSEAQLAAADRSLDVARAAFLPVFNLTASGGVVGSDLLPRNYDVFSLGGSVLQPLFQGGRLTANADAAASRRDQAAFAYRKTALNAFREVEDGLAAVDGLGQQETVLARQRDALAQTYSMAQKRFGAGYSPYLEQIDAQRALLQTELLLIQARSDRLNATITLYQALGGGYQN